MCSKGRLGQYVNEEDDIVSLINFAFMWQSEIIFYLPIASHIPPKYGISQMSQTIRL
jgi:hypothetical protein